jgi:hypothetical protein
VKLIGVLHNLLSNEHPPLGGPRELVLGLTWNIAARDIALEAQLIVIGYKL